MRIDVIEGGMRKFFVCIAVVLLSQSAAMGQDISSSCKIYRLGESVPVRYARMMRENNDVVARVCSKAESDINYYSVSDVWSDWSRVCLFQEISRSRKKLSTRGTYMSLLHGDRCKSQEAPGYILTEGISSGMFRAAVTFWNEQSLNSKSSLFDAIYSKGGVFSLRMRQALKSETPPALLGIRFLSPLYGTNSGGYELRFYLDEVSQGAVNIDLDGRGFKVISVGRFVN